MGYNQVEAAEGRVILIRGGLDAKYVSERLGHESVQTTLEMYGHVTSKRRRDAPEPWLMDRMPASVAPLAPRRGPELDTRGFDALFRIWRSGAPGGNRTPCLAVRSRTLCPVSY